jgi:hypothetical protein
MILIPELETIVISPPRTGSTSLKQAILRQYPLAMSLYRHMEADGVPFGYDQWRRVGVVRAPGSRLFSLYNYLQRLEHDDPYWAPGRAAKYKASVARIPFDVWLQRNELPFCTGWGDDMSYNPRYSVRHAMPETRKSQEIYLRPDLGTEVYKFTDIGFLARALNVVMLSTNETNVQVPLSQWWRGDVRAILCANHSWDAEVAGGWFDDEVQS